MKIIIIEDNTDIVSIVSMALKIRWPDIEILSSNEGEKGISLIGDENPDMVILDIGLPDMCGFEVLEQIKTFSLVPVIILTVNNSENDIVRGLELGADDYITKPFRPLELISRINAVLRRQHIPGHGNPVKYMSLLLQSDLRSVFVEDKKINLTKTEGIILFQLLRNAEKVVPISTLAEAIWDYSDASTSESLRVYIHRLRNKIEKDPRNPMFIHTKSGIGYILKAK